MVGKGGWEAGRLGGGEARRWGGREAGRLGSWETGKSASENIRKAGSKQTNEFCKQIAFGEDEVKLPHLSGDDDSFKFRY